MHAHKLESEGPPLTVAEFAKSAGVCRNTVDNDIKAGKITTFRIGRRVFIPRAWAHRFLTTGER
jgi:excisionase family DNA binding protein